MTDNVKIDINANDSVQMSNTSTDPIETFYAQKLVIIIICSLCFTICFAIAFMIVIGAPVIIMVTSSHNRTRT